MRNLHLYITTQRYKNSHPTTLITVQSFTDGVTHKVTDLFIKTQGRIPSNNQLNNVSVILSIILIVTFLRRICY